MILLETANFRSYGLHALLICFNVLSVWIKGIVEHCFHTIRHCHDCKSVRQKPNVGYDQTDPVIIDIHLKM